MVKHDWEIRQAQGQCVRCSRPIEEEVPFYSILCVGGDDTETLLRYDVCLSCWEQKERHSGHSQAAVPQTHVIATWRTVRQAKEQPRCAYVRPDIDLVWQLFQDLGTRACSELQEELRYVLALLLLRRRRLTLRATGGGVLHLVDREGKAYHLTDAALSEERIRQLTDRLGELLWECQVAAP